MNSKFMRCAFAHWLNLEWNVTTQDGYYLSNKPNIFLTASEVGVNLKQGYNGDISSKDAGRVGGNMVRKLIQQAENNMK